MVQRKQSKTSFTWIEKKTQSFQSFKMEFGTDRYMWKTCLQKYNIIYVIIRSPIFDRGFINFDTSSPFEPNFWWHVWMFVQKKQKAPRDLAFTASANASSKAPAADELAKFSRRNKACDAEIPVLATWMSQEVSSWLVNGLYPTCKWHILGL